MREQQTDEEREVIRNGDYEVSHALWAVVLRQIEGCGIQSRFAYTIRGKLMTIRKLDVDLFRLTNR